MKKLRVLGKGTIVRMPNVHYLSLGDVVYRLCQDGKEKHQMGQQAQQTKKATTTKRQAAVAVSSQATTRKPAEKHRKLQSITPEDRQRLIAEKAYHIAEQRGFQGDEAMNDWLQAEMEVDARFAERH
jgi:acetyl-CoA acetyltransferase